MMDPYVISAMPFILFSEVAIYIIEIPSFCYGNATYRDFSCLSYHVYCHMILTN